MKQGKPLSEQLQRSGLPALWHDRWCHVVVGYVAGLGWLANGFLFLEWSPQLSLWVWLPAWILLPLCASSGVLLRKRLRDTTEGILATLILRYAVAAVLLGLLYLESPNSAAAGGLLFATGALIVRARQEVAAVLVLFIAAFQVWAATQVEAAFPVWILGPLIVTYVTIAMLWLHARSSYRRLLSQGVTPATGEAPRHDEMLPRALLGLVLAMLVLALGFPLHRSLTPWWSELPVSKWLGAAGDWASANEGDEIDDDELEDEPLPEEPVRRASALKNFPTSLEANRALGPIDRGLVFEAAIVATGANTLLQNKEPLYFTTSIFDRFAGFGVDTSLPAVPPRTANQIGRTLDNWIYLNMSGLTAQAAHLSIQQRPQRLQAQAPEFAHSVLFRQEPLIAIEELPLLYEPDGNLLLIDPPETRIRYQLLIEPEDTDPMLASEFQLASVAPRYGQLPDQHRDWPEIAAAAAAVVGDAASPSEALARTRAYFRDSFRYSTDMGGDPTRHPVLRLLNQKRGYCVHYAMAAAMILRTAGVPCRIVAGYRATWSPKWQLYQARNYNAHAWVELPIADHGWTRFDPTPATPYGAFLTRLAPQVEEEQSFASLDGEVPVNELDPEEEEALLAETNETPEAGTGPFVPQEVPEMERMLAVSLSLIAGAIVGITWLSRRRRSPKAEIRLSAEAIEFRSRYEQLLAALRKHGFDKKRSQTPREFAHQICARGGASYTPLLNLTEEIYRSRFGGWVMIEQTELELDHFLEWLRRELPRQANERVGQASASG